MAIIRTVLGDIDANSLRGRILPHEHLWIDLRNQAVPEASSRPVTPEDHPRLMQDPYALKDNLLVGDETIVLDECRQLQQYGCSLVVDCSTPQIGRAPEKLKALSARSGMHIVMGCGFYTGDTFSPEVANTPAELLAEEIGRECLRGVNDDGGIRPGVLGEFGTSKEILPHEARALEAAAIVHEKTGLGIQVHIYPWSNNGIAVTEILRKGNVPPEKIVICHSDVAPDTAYIHALLKLGVFVEFDNFGKEFTPQPGASFAGGDFCTDRERCRLLAELIRQGWSSQLLISNDICLKCMLTPYGGKGYAHLFRDVLPMMQDEGLSPEDWQPQILEENPKRFLSI